MLTVDFSKQKKMMKKKMMKEMMDPCINYFQTTTFLHKRLLVLLEPKSAPPSAPHPLSH